MPDNSLIMPPSPRPPSKIPPVSKEEMEKRPWCPYIYVPVAYGEQTTVPGMGTGMQMKTDLSLFKCIHEQCAIWDPVEKMCSVKSKARALSRIADALEKKAVV